MSSWTFTVYFCYRAQDFAINPTMRYADILQIYDERFRCHIVLNDDYIRRLQDRLPKTSISSLVGRIVKRQSTTKATCPYPRTLDRRRNADLSAILRTNHMIVWLDSYIGRPENCSQLKYRFITTTMVDTARSSSLFECDIDNLIVAYPYWSINERYLHAFYTKEDCVNFLNQVQSSMKIILISSISLGEQIAPLIFDRVHTVYLLRDDFVLPYEWAMKYSSILQMFDHDTCLLIRLTRDIALDFVDKAQKCLVSSPEMAIIYLQWARKLYNRANEIDDPECLNMSPLKTIDWQLKKLELNCSMSSSGTDDEDEKNALECDEG